MRQYERSSSHSSDINKSRIDYKIPKYRIINCNDNIDFGLEDIHEQKEFYK